MMHGDAIIAICVEVSSCLKVQNKVTDMQDITVWKFIVPVVMDKKVHAHLVADD